MASEPSAQAVRRAYRQAAGRRLEERHTRRGWTRDELAARAGLSSALIAAYERHPERYPEWRPGGG